MITDKDEQIKRDGLRKSDMIRNYVNWNNVSEVYIEPLNTTQLMEWDPEVKRIAERKRREKVS